MWFSVYRRFFLMLGYNKPLILICNIEGNLLEYCEITLLVISSIFSSDCFTLPCEFVVQYQNSDVSQRLT